jgi:hypothetical protein
MLQAGQPRSTRWSFYLYRWMSSRNMMLHSKLDIPTPPFPPVRGHDQRVSHSWCDAEFAMFAHHRRSTSSSSDRARSARLGLKFRNRPCCIVEEKLDTACNTAMTKDEGDDEAHSDDRGPPLVLREQTARVLAITPEYASLSDFSTCHMIRHCA